MSQYIEVPPSRLPADVLQALLEDYASRDGTDYGEREFTLAEKVEHLRAQMSRKELYILFDSESEQWDLMTAEHALPLLQG